MKQWTLVSPQNEFILKNECRNSIVMMYHYSDLGSASDLSCYMGNLLQRIRNTTNILVVIVNSYVVSTEFLHLSFNGETSSKIIKYQLLSATMTFFDEQWFAYF